MSKVRGECGSVCGGLRKKNQVFQIFRSYIGQIQNLIGTVRCKIAGGIVWWYFRRKIWFQSKVIAKKLKIM